MTERQDKFLVSILIPVFNEQDNIRSLHDEITRHLEDIGQKEIIFINDGSSDQTLAKIRDLRSHHKSVQYLSLSRNFGHQNALRAGLDFCSGDIVISMDGDHQHPPRLLPELIQLWKEGYDVVVTTREDLEESRFLKKWTSQTFYLLMSKISNIDIKPGSADFRLLDKKVVDVLRRFGENDIFYRGCAAWSGFKQFELSYAPDERGSGSPKYTARKMIRLALNGLLGFSTLPLRIATIVGLFISLFSFIYGMYAVLIRIFSDAAVSGWASIMTGIYFLGGIQLLCIGICGEYIGRIFMEVKKRPHYIIADSSLDSKKGNIHS